MSTITIEDSKSPLFLMSINCMLNWFIDCLLPRIGPKCFLDVNYSFGIAEAIYVELEY